MKINVEYGCDIEAADAELVLTTLGEAALGSGDELVSQQVYAVLQFVRDIIDTAGNGFTACLPPAPEVTLEVEDAAEKLHELHLATTAVGELFKPAHVVWAFDCDLIQWDWLTD